MTAFPHWTEAATKLATEVTGLAPSWHEAVSSTPRHLLVPRWWERVPDSPVEAWRLVAPGIGSAEHLAAAYSDSTLVTRAGARHADHARSDDEAQGKPTSSSTLPGLVVSMLGRLDVRAGHRVLDVGTGTGYSAALLAHRIGDSAVTSVDVDPYLVSAARKRLERFGRRPRLVETDATERLPGAEYDRIVATVSVRPIPSSWVWALRPGGRLVTTIAGTALMIVADMHADGVARGTVQPDAATFMAARNGTDYAPALHDVFAAAREGAGEDARPAAGPLPNLWEDWSLRWLFELDSPGVETRATTFPDGSRRLWLLAGDGSWARAEGTRAAGTGPENATVRQSGARRLWDELERVERRWQAAGRFPLSTMRAELRPDGSRLIAPDGLWPFAI